MNELTALAVGVVLLLGNAFFVGAEFAVLSARRSQIEPLAATSGRARQTLTAMEQVSLMLATCQLGITLCSLGLGAVAEPALAHLLEPVFASLGVPAGLLHPVALVLALTVVVYLHVVVGEMIPKNLAIAGPERSALLLAPPLLALGRLLGPVIRALNGITNAALRLVGVEPKDEVASAFTAEEVQSIVAESQREGTLEDTQGLLSGALEFSERSVGDLAVPLDRLVTVAVGATPQDVESLVARTGYSRFPVQDAHGDLAGYLHLKDILYADDERYTQPVPDKRVRSLVTLGAAEEVEDALASMRRNGSHLARVVDPSGRVAGVVFLEDVLEELVGEVRDATQRAAAR
ncbi:CBS domain containing-hemolysin-like protein [Kineococcus xinjiangensis]|uniref:CBS domain containing-hemolysin-like protein n=1 Tax=Kineococcus xinjiangensis TaxID=512762 RepID=A0A2S6IWJ5_9ACTN|nr:hemolysin family protein [Kineococcus xinjiangensis]PPK98703.1 CBS domain containing-hemolysin-like protein [Kineococcus xinjiangensis]